MRWFHFIFGVTKCFFSLPKGTKVNSYFYASLNKGKRIKYASNFQSYLKMFDKTTILYNFAGHSFSLINSKAYRKATLLEYIASLCFGKKDDDDNDDDDWDEDKRGVWLTIFGIECESKKKGKIYLILMILWKKKEKKIT